METIKIDRNPLGETVDLYCFDELQLTEAITALFGCNGSGKSFMLWQIEQYLKENDIDYMVYDKREEELKWQSIETGSELIKFGSIFESTGERNSTMFCQWAKKVVSRAKKSNGKLFLLIDGIDEGLSLDVQFATCLHFNVLVRLCAEDNCELKIVFTTNSYEMLFPSFVDSVNVQTGEHVEFNNYSQFAKMTTDTMVYKNKRLDQIEEDERKGNKK